MTIDLAGCSDADLASLALGGQQAAYGEIVKRHREAVYRLVRSQVGDADEALDVTQNSFIAALSNLARYDRSRPFRHWIARIALNKCRDWARRRAVRRFFSFAAPIHEAENVPDEAIALDVQMSDAEELERVLRAIAALPASLKEPLVLRAQEGLSHAQVAKVLGITEKAVEIRIYRARQRLMADLGSVEILRRTKEG